MKFEDTLKVLKQTIRITRSDFLMLTKKETEALVIFSEQFLQVAVDLKKLRKDEDPRAAILFLQNRYEKLIKSLLDNFSKKDQSDSDKD